MHKNVYSQGAQSLSSMRQPLIGGTDSFENIGTQMTGRAPPPDEEVTFEADAEVPVLCYVRSEALARDVGVASHGRDYQRLACQMTV